MNVYGWDRVLLLGPLLRDPLETFRTTTNYDNE